MRAPRRKQRGAALLVLAAIVVLGVSWVMVTALGSASQVTFQGRERNARVLAEAKAALIGWIAANALENDENNPGRLPCPQAWGDVGSPVNEGRAAGSCSAPAAGWLPWRTLGIPKPLDASGNQLWYVIAPGWHLPSAGATLTINSNTAGGLTADGQAAVALLIAPGPALRISPTAAQTAAGCTARSQSQALNPPAALNALDFLECQNGTTADNAFTASVVDNATNPVFNDQVLPVTTADVLPILEATIAKRIEREIVPQLKAVYASNTWGTNVSAANPVLPFAAPFLNPTTSNYQGAAATTGGLLPFNQTQGCNPATDARCVTATTGPETFHVFSKSAADTYVPLIDLLNPLDLGWIKTQATCTWTGNTYVCTGEYQAFPIKVTLQLRVTNVAMGLRTFDPTKVSCTAKDDAGLGLGTQPIGCESVSVAMQPDGSAIVTVTTNFTPSIILSGWGTYANYVINFDREVFGDHALLDSTTLGVGATGWFVRNEWYRLLYYAAAPGFTSTPLPAATSCANGTTCLTVTNLTPAGRQRALLILAGRSVGGQMRPGDERTRYLELGNTTGAYVQNAVNSSFNDRVVVVDVNP